MELGQAQANAGHTSAEQQTVEKTETNEHTQELQDAVAKATHQRVLSESKQFKSRAVAAEERLKLIEDEALKIQQNHEERATRFETELKQTKAEKSALLKRVTLEPALRAAGCVDVATAIQIGDLNLLLEEGGQLSGVDEFVGTLKQGKPYLFLSQIPSSVNASMPSGGLKVSTATPDVKSLSSKELMDALKAMDKKG